MTSTIEQDALTERNLILRIRKLEADIEQLKRSVWSGAEQNRLSRLNIGSDGAQAGQGELVVDGGIGIGDGNPTATVPVVVIVDGGGNPIFGVLRNSGTNSADDVVVLLDTVAGGGNPFLRLRRAGNFEWTVGQDVADSNKFKISGGGSAEPGSNDKFILTSDGLAIANLGNFRSGSQSINDDAVYSFQPAQSSGMMLIKNAGGGGGSQVAAVLAWRIGAGPFCVLLAQPGSTVEVTTGALAGTTGTDTKFTVSAHTDGKLYLENRTGGTVAVGWTLIG